MLELVGAGEQTLEFALAVRADVIRSGALGDRFGDGRRVVLVVILLVDGSHTPVVGASTVIFGSVAVYIVIFAAGTVAGIVLGAVAAAPGMIAATITAPISVIFGRELIPRVLAANLFNQALSLPARGQDVHPFRQNQLFEYVLRDPR